MSETPIFKPFVPETGYCHCRHRVKLNADGSNPCRCCNEPTFDLPDDLYADEPAATPAQPTPADLANHISYTAQKLAARLTAPKPDHQEIGVRWGDLSTAIAALDQALGITNHRPRVRQRDKHATDIIRSLRRKVRNLKAEVRIRDTLIARYWKAWMSEMALRRNAIRTVQSLTQKLREAETSRDALRDLSGRHLDRLRELEEIDKAHAECSSHLFVLLEQRDAHTSRAVDAESERDALLTIVRAFVEHHDGGQAGQPGHPKTYGEEEVWQAEWDSKYAAIRQLSAGRD